jgi:hypothetical protein
MTNSLTVTRERKLPSVLPHQLLESFQCHDFPERNVNRFRSGFHPENSRGLIRQLGIEPDRCYSHSHGSDRAKCYIYTLDDLYIQIKGCLPVAPALFWLAANRRYGWTAFIPKWWRTSAPLASLSMWRSMMLMVGL